jgi:hypothetical protein
MPKIQKQQNSQRILRIDIIYKRKVNKIKPMDSNESDNNTPEKSKSWREDIIRKKIKNINPDPDNLYTK